MSANEGHRLPIVKKELDPSKFIGDETFERI